MAIRVGINGFGRIGRLVFRAMRAQKGRFDVVAVNDLAPAKSLAHLLKYDTVHRRYPGTVEVSGDGIKVDGDQIEILNKRNPRDLPWGERSVDYVVESTGLFRKVESEKGGYGDHIEAGAKCVVLSAPAGDDPKLLADTLKIGGEVVRTVVMGVNDDKIRPDDRFVSNASCTTNCLAPVAMVLDDAFGIEAGLMTTVHSPTNDQVVQDAIHKDLRRARSGFQNIIPTTTGAARAIGLVLPSLDGKLDGFAIRVAAHLPTGRIHT
jgi:glyceraldehyde 3-phosphate dehydrogenase